MKNIISMAAIAAITLGVAGQAHAKLCNLTGTYTETYGVATATIKGKKGTLAAPSFCATNYTFKISAETATGFTVTGTNTDMSCGTFMGNLTFVNSCEVFTGSVTIKGQTISDTFTEQNTARVSPFAPSELTKGFR